MMERRMLNSKELRFSGGSKPRIQGYAATFNTEAQVNDFKEVIRRGAFDRALREKQDVVCLFNHDSNHVLGRTSSGTLRLSQDKKGLYFVCDLPDTQVARDLHQSIQRGDVNGCSFAFTLPNEGAQTWSQRGGSMLREITDMDLHDVSPVTYPCYSETSVDARQLERVGQELRKRQLDAADEADLEDEEDEVLRDENGFITPEGAVARLNSSRPSLDEDNEALKRGWKICEEEYARARRNRFLNL